MSVLALCFWVFVGFLLGCLAAFLFLRSKLRDLAWYEETHLYLEDREGISILHPHYYIRSSDGGCTWNAAVRDGCRMIILGPAEEVYPGLLDHLDTLWSAAAEYERGLISKEVIARNPGFYREAGIPIE